MAAHWGNEEFSKLGYLDDSSEPEHLAAEPIGGFITLLAIGVICGGICFIIAYRQESKIEKF